MEQSGNANLSKFNFSNPHPEAPIIFPERHLARLYVLQLSFGSIGEHKKTPQTYYQLKEEWNRLCGEILSGFHAAPVCPRCGNTHPVRIRDQDQVAGISKEMRDADPSDPRSGNLEKMQDWITRLTANRDLLDTSIPVQIDIEYLQALQRVERNGWAAAAEWVGEKMKEEWDRLVTETIIFFNEEVISCKICGTVHDDVLLGNERRLMSELADLQREMRCADPATMDRSSVCVWIRRFARFEESFNRDLKRLRGEGGRRCMNDG
jgi:rubrerythrin